MQLPHSPIVCHDIIGDPLLTFYSYLVIRCVADLSLMVCFLAIDSLGVYYSANFDTIYGGFQKALSLGTSSFIWPVVSGSLIDYFSSSISGKPDYSAAFVLFVGFMLIGCSLVVSLQIAPSTSEFQYMKRNHNLSNTFIADLCGSNLNCDKLGKEHKQNALYSSRPELNQLIRVSFKSKLLLVLIVPFVVLLGFYFSLTQLQMNTYYLSLGASKFMIGLVTSAGFLISSVFILIIKPLLSAVGRLNLIVLGFVFYGLQLAGDSLLSSNVKWSLLPFNSMVAFSFVLSWIGCTSHLHHLMKLNRMGHVKLQLCIGLIQFGYGRILAAVVWFFFFYYFDRLHKCWPIGYFEIEEFDSRPINRIELLHEMNAFRVLIRILSLFAFVFAVVFFVFYQLLSKCEQVNCKWHRDRRSSRKNRRLVREESDDDERDINVEEEADSLTKTATTKSSRETEVKFKQPNGKSSGSMKSVKNEKSDRTDGKQRKVYRPLSFFQSNRAQQRAKGKEKLNKRKPTSANIIKFKIDQQDKRKIGEEMV